MAGLLCETIVRLEGVCARERVCSFMPDCVHVACVWTHVSSGVEAESRAFVRMTRGTEEGSQNSGGR